jgi:hypothetical protein
LEGTPVPDEYPGEVKDHVDGEGARDRRGGDGWAEVDPGEALGLLMLSTSKERIPADGVGYKDGHIGKDE